MLAVSCAYIKLFLYKHLFKTIKNIINYVTYKNSQVLYQIYKILSLLI